MRESERGESLVEVVVASAILALVIAAALSGALSGAHRFGPLALDEALQNAAQRETRIAVDVLKYQGGAIAPNAVATTVPMPGGSPEPSHLSIATSPLGGGGYAISVTASDDRSGRSMTVTSTVARPVPLPSSQITSPTSGRAPM